MPFSFHRQIKRGLCLLIFLLGHLCTQSTASDVQQNIKKLAIGTYIEGTYFVNAQKRRFQGYINRTQGYAVTLTTQQLPHRRRITYQSIDRLRVKKTKKFAIQYNPDARPFLTRSGVAPGRRAVVGALGGRFSGIIASVTDSCLVLAATHKRDEYKMLAVSELDQMSINLDKTSYLKKGFKAGVVTGFFIGVIFSSSSLNNNSETGWSALANIVLSPKTAIFSLAGAGIGSLIGKLAYYETWHAIPLDRLKFTHSHLPLPLTASYSF